MYKLYTLSPPPFNNKSTIYNRPPFIYGVVLWYVHFCGIHIYKLSLLDNEYIRNIYYGDFMVYTILSG